MTENVKPLADWDNEQSSNPNLVWWSRLDNRYQIEVHRKGEREAKLVIFDRKDNNKVLMSLNVGLSYGVIFGPDVDDITYWQEMACNCGGTGWRKLAVPHVRGCWALDMILGKE